MINEFVILQVMNLKETEIEWLSNHMGHTVGIHKSNYRLHESTLEMARVSGILLAIDSGDFEKFMGKSLDSIPLRGNVYFSNLNLDIYHPTFVVGLIVK